MKKFGVPGGALAVAKDGKLVVAKGYGWANVAARQPVTMDSLFCLASVSKAVTSVAVMRLVQDGKLSLDDRVYRLLGRPKPLEGFQLDPRVKDITVRHLLLHAAGFDPRKGGEYMQMARKIAKQTGHKLPMLRRVDHPLCAEPSAGLRARHGRALLQFRLLPRPGSGPARQRPALRAIRAAARLAAGRHHRHGAGAAGAFLLPPTRSGVTAARAEGAAGRARPGRSAGRQLDRFRGGHGAFSDRGGRQPRQGDPVARPRIGRCWPRRPRR